MERKLRWTVTLTMLLIVALALPLGLGLRVALASSPEQPGKEGAAAPAEGKHKVEPIEVLGIVISIAVTTAGACFAAGYAVGKVGAAALGAVSERPEILGRTLIFVGLAEGIAIYGLIVAILLMGYLRG